MNTSSTPKTSEVNSNLLPIEYEIETLSQFTYPYAWLLYICACLGLDLEVLSFWRDENEE